MNVCACAYGIIIYADIKEYVFKCTERNMGMTRQMKTRGGGDLPVVPDLEQRIQERCSALQRAAALSGAGRCSGPDAPDSPSSEGESSVATWPSAQLACSSRYKTSDNII
ncbi:hypothetical protein NDU88_003058 [Pleurodeles waltl]|uniref:Uncharacterized protein n=1 Tax=Pleurodeles waltl TaxID=8319 RepID=A0AAV7MPQ6_PLEWA|nr:hypothetical protein NDU88_003058 [Pleurodeles waltl]